MYVFLHICFKETKTIKHYYHWEMKSEPVQVIDLALKRVNLLLLLARALKGFSVKGFQRFHTIQDVRPATHFSQFYGRCTTKQKKRKNKNGENQTTQWRFSPTPGEDIDSTGFLSLQRGMDKTRKSVLFSCCAFTVPWNDRILEQAGPRLPTERSLYGSWNGVLWMMAAHQP